MATIKNNLTTQLPLKKLSKSTKKLAKIEEKTHRQFHAKASTKKKKQAAGQTPTEPAETPGIRPDESSVECKHKKAVVVVGCLTGNPVADAAFRNTANEAVSDLTDRGYKTTLLDQPTNAQVQAFIADPCVKAFVYVGHGSDSDSGDENIGGRDGSDFLWPNCEEVITSGDIRRWINGGSMDLVILHACYQGAENTATRWQNAFGVDETAYSSWSGLCRYFTAYWWQFAWY